MPPLLTRHPLCAFDWLSHRLKTQARSPIGQIPSGPTVFLGCQHVFLVGVDLDKRSQALLLLAFIDREGIWDDGDGTGELKRSIVAQGPPMLLGRRWS